jgi:uncharacterized membrane protein
MTRTAYVPRRSKLPAGLLILAAIPTVAGVLRLYELIGQPEVTPDNARFLSSPMPITVHIVTATAFSVIGAFQFSPRLRRIGWHRLAGRFLLPAGAIAAASAMWLSVWSELPTRDDELLRLFRLGFGSAMLGSLGCAALAIRRRDFASHAAWMSRGYAIGLGAGTQAFTLGAHTALTGAEPVGTARSWLMFAGWAINLTAVEWRLGSERRSGGRSEARESKVRS